MHPILKKFDLSGRSARLTGSSAGIGFALAGRFDLLFEATARRR